MTELEDCKILGRVQLSLSHDAVASQKGRVKCMQRDFLVKAHRDFTFARTTPFVAAFTFGSLLYQT